MNWLNLETKIRTAPEFIGSEPPQRATWLCLMLYCAEHENGGVISDCGGWGDRRWMQTCGITKAEAHSACELWKLEGGALRIWGYPLEREREVAAKRDGGRMGGFRSGASRQMQAQGLLFDAPAVGSEGQHEGQHEGQLEGQLERKGKERKGKKGNGKEDSTNLLAAFDLFWTAYDKKVSKGQALRAFRAAMQKTTLPVMLAAIALQKETDKWKKGYQPYPATWLNGEGWEDDVRAMNDTRPTGKRVAGPLDLSAGSRDALVREARREEGK